MYWRQVFACSIAPSKITFPLLVAILSLLSLLLLYVQEDIPLKIWKIIYIIIWKIIDLSTTLSTDFHQRAPTKNIRLYMKRNLNQVPVFSLSSQITLQFCDVFREYKRVHWKQIDLGSRENKEIFWKSQNLVETQPSVKFRRSQPEMFCKKGVLRNFAKFTRKHLCQSFRPQGSQKLWHRTPPVAASLNFPSLNRILAILVNHTSRSCLILFSLL